MSRKHYIAFARMVSELALNKSQKRHVAEELADVLKSENSAFDRDRFLVACGVAA